MAFNISFIYELTDRASPGLRAIKRAKDAAARAATLASDKVRKLSSSFSEMRRRARDSKASIDDLSGAWTKFIGIAAAALAVAFPIKQAIAFESAMAEVAKVVEFKEPEGLKNMAASIKEMSKTIPLTPIALSEIVAAGGQLGIPAEKLEQFAITAAKMSIAFDILPNAAGESMAKLSNIFGVPITEMERIGDAINFVSNNAAASAADIVTALRSGAGAGARALGLTEVQAIALSTAFVAQGLSASEAGTRVQILARNLLNTTKTSKILGAEFDSLVRSSPQEAINQLLDRIAAGAIPNEKLNQLLGETVNDFTLLAKNGEGYAKILGLVADETRFAGSMNKEFASRSATTDNQLKLLGNSVRLIGNNLGTALLPTVNSVAKGLSVAANFVGDFAEKFPGLTKFIGGAVIGIIALKAATLAWTVAQVGINLALAANPIGLIVTGIAAAIGVAIVFKDEIAAIFNKIVAIGKIVGSLNPFGLVLSAGGAIAEFIGIGGGSEPAVAAPGGEMSGQLDVKVTLAGDTGAVQSVQTSTPRLGNLGVNAVVTP